MSQLRQLNGVLVAGSRSRPLAADGCSCSEAVNGDSEMDIGIRVDKDVVRGGNLGGHLACGRSIQGRGKNGLRERERIPGKKGMGGKGGIQSVGDIVQIERSACGNANQCYI